MIRKLLLSAFAFMALCGTAAAQDRPLSAFTSASAATGAEYLWSVQGGNTRKMTVDQVAVRALAYDPEIACLSGLTSAADKMGLWTGSGTCSLVDTTSYGRSLLNATDAAALRSLAGAVIGTNVQAFNANLSCLGGEANVNGKIPYYLGSGTCGSISSYSFTRGMLGAGTDGLAVRTYIGIGTGDSPTLTALALSSTTDASLASTGHGFQIGPSSGQNVIIDNNEMMARNNGAVSNLSLQFDGGTLTVGGATTINSSLTATGALSGASLTLTSPLAVAQGGTGASDASTARANLGLAIGTNVQAYDADLTDLSDGKVERLLFSDATGYTNTGDTAENTVLTMTNVVPANAMGTKGFLRVRIYGSTLTNSANSKLIRVYWGGNLVLQRALTSNRTYVQEVYIHNRGATAQVGYPATAANIESGSGVALYSYAVDTTAASTMTVTIQNANAGDSTTLEAIGVWVTKDN